MNRITVVHRCAPAADLGDGRLTCCGLLPSDLPVRHAVTTNPAEVTCRLRHIAELPVDQDRGESPFGWSDSPEEAVNRLTAALSTVREQCRSWSAPTAATAWETRLRDRSIALAAGVLIEVIDHMVPGLDTGRTDEERAQTPTLRDRIAAVLRDTPRAEYAEWGPRSPHTDGDGGHDYDMRCALCTNDVDTLTDALTRALILLPPTDVTP